MGLATDGWLIKENLMVCSGNNCFWDTKDEFTVWRAHLCLPSPPSPASALRGLATKWCTLCVSCLRTDSSLSQGALKAQTWGVARLELRGWGRRWRAETQQGCAFGGPVWARVPEATSSGCLFKDACMLCEHVTFAQGCMTSS